MRPLRVKKTGPNVTLLLTATFRRIVTGYLHFFNVAENVAQNVHLKS